MKKTVPTVPSFAWLHGNPGKFASRRGSSANRGKRRKRPPLKYIDLKGDDLDPVRVLAMMYFPNNETMRRHFFAIKRVDQLVKDAKPGERFTVCAQELDELANMPGRKEVLVAVTEAARRGHVAGDVLSTLYSWERSGLPGPSLNKVIEACMRFAKKNTYGDGVKMHPSEYVIRKYWREFISVAHLWAAFRINKNFPYVQRGTEFQPQHLEVFLGIARGIGQFAESFIPARTHSKVPIVAPRTFIQIPGSIPSRHLTIHQTA